MSITIQHHLPTASIPIKEARAAQRKKARYEIHPDEEDKFVRQPVDGQQSEQTGKKDA